MKNEKTVVASKTAHSRPLKLFRASAALMLTTLMLVVATSTGATGQTTFKTLHSFNETGGSGPYAGLVQATNGNLYGTTYEGANPDEYGTVFKITPSGTLTTLHSFDFTDGEAPDVALIQAFDGNLYGTTTTNGAHDSGTVFQITTGGKLTTLYNFCSQSGCTDGMYPVGLVQATNGDFYGTTAEGGTYDAGTVFKITPSGTLTTLHSFCTEGGSSCTDGSEPAAGLVQATNGDFYGTTSNGGTSDLCAPCGTVFKITPSGTLTTLHSFCTEGGSSCTDGTVPEAGLVQATDGNFYGTTYDFGAHGYGTVFKITPSGTLTTLHSFDGTDGGDPIAGLVQATRGYLYGTTWADGTGGGGTVFSLSVGLGPFVEMQSTSGKEGAKIGILGQGFSSSSVVKFGGTKATAIVLSGTTFITATVPAGALTGAVTVTTGTTTLTSTKAFDLLPTTTSFLPESGPVGTPVTIKGTGLKQTTRVTFDGKSATFTVISDSEVKADVPTGALTGKITVSTKGGTATSASVFTVTT
jgi:uncharacterized repeat protein (TIGR03803 family)